MQNAQRNAAIHEVIIAAFRTIIVQNSQTNKTCKESLYKSFAEIYYITCEDELFVKRLVVLRKRRRS